MAGWSPSARRRWHLTPSGFVRRDDEIFGGSLAQALGDGPVSEVTAHGLCMRYVVGPWHERGHLALLRERTIQALFFQQGEAVGAAKLGEYALSPLLDDERFYDLMEAISASACALACVLLSGWSVETLARLGRLIELRRLWMRPAAACAGSWRGPLREWLHRAAARHHAALLMLRPFPLEYEGTIGGLGASKAALAERQAALRRLYGRALGACRLRDTDWMWLPLVAGLPPPGVFDDET